VREILKMQLFGGFCPITRKAQDFFVVGGTTIRREDFAWKFIEADAAMPRRDQKVRVEAEYIRKLGQKQTHTLYIVEQGSVDMKTLTLADLKRAASEDVRGIAPGQAPPQKSFRKRTTFELDTRALGPGDEVVTLLAFVVYRSFSYTVTTLTLTRQTPLNGGVPFPEDEDVQGGGNTGGMPGEAPPPVSVDCVLDKEGNVVASVTLNLDTEVNTVYLFAYEPGTDELTDALAPNQEVDLHVSGQGTASFLLRRVEGIAETRHVEIMAFGAGRPADAPCLVELPADS
jgi:hypothetical protein